MLSNKFGRFARNYRSNQASFQGIFMRLCRRARHQLALMYTVSLRSGLRRWTQTFPILWGSRLRRSFFLPLFFPYVFIQILNLNHPDPLTPKRWKTLALLRTPSCHIFVEKLRALLSTLQKKYSIPSCFQVTDRTLRILTQRCCKFDKFKKLVGGLVNPSEKYATVKLGSSSPTRDEKKQKIKNWNHHLPAPSNFGAK